MKIYITADFSEEAINRLRNEGHEVRVSGWGFTGEILNEDDLIKEIGDSEILIVGYESITRKVLDNTNLKIISSIRGGPEANIDIDYATTLNIPVMYTLGREAIPVADFTIGQIIGLVRQIVRTDRELHRGKFLAPLKEYGTEKDVYWDMSDEGPWQSRKGHELNGKTLGLVGFGTIGQQVAKRAVCFGMRVIAYDPYQPNPSFVKYRVKKVSLEELMKESDIVSIHARSTESNKGMIGKKEFSLMKNGAYFINNARATVINEEAMREAIMSGKIGGAALDVFNDEPIRSDDPLLKLDNVILTPHIAGAGFEVIYRHSNMIVDDLNRLLEGEMPKVIKNPGVIKNIGEFSKIENSINRNVKKENLVESKKNREILTLADIKIMLGKGEKINIDNFILTPLALDFIKKNILF